MMKLQDVLLKAMAKKITWRDAAGIIGGDRSDDASLAGEVEGARLFRHDPAAPQVRIHKLPHFSFSGNVNAIRAASIPDPVAIKTNCLPLLV